MRAAVIVVALNAALASGGRAQQARAARIPLEFRFARVDYAVLPVDSADTAHGIAIGRTTAYGLQWRHPLAGPLAQVWSVEYAGRRSAYDQGVCLPGAASCARAPRVFAYKDWSLRGTAVVRVPPRRLPRPLRWIVPYAGAGLGLHAVTEPHLEDRELVRGRLRTSWFGETSYHVEGGAHVAVPHTRLVGSAEVRWSWMTWRNTPERLRQTSLAFLVIARL